MIATDSQPPGRQGKSPQPDHAPAPRELLEAIRYRATLVARAGDDLEEFVYRAVAQLNVAQAARLLTDLENLMSIIDTVEAGLWDLKERKEGACAR
jgi:hypothetical protein